MAAKSQRELLAFNRGEITPLLSGRTDVQAISAGCRQLRNMIVETQGGVSRRPGLQFIALARQPQSAPPVEALLFMECVTGAPTEFAWEALDENPNDSQYEEMPTTMNGQPQQLWWITTISDPGSGYREFEVCNGGTAESRWWIAQQT